MNLAEAQKNPAARDALARIAAGGFGPEEPARLAAIELFYAEEYGITDTMTYREVLRLLRESAAADPENAQNYLRAADFVRWMHRHIRAYELFELPRQLERWAASQSPGAMTITPTRARSSLPGSTPRSSRRRVGAASAPERPSSGDDDPHDPGGQPGRRRGVEREGS